MDCFRDAVHLAVGLALRQQLDLQVQSDLPQQLDLQVKRAHLQLQVPALLELQMWTPQQVLQFESVQETLPHLELQQQVQQLFSLVLF